MVVSFCYCVEVQTDSDKKDGKRERDVERKMSGVWVMICVIGINVQWSC